jgi:hypothetical protein
MSIVIPSYDIDWSTGVVSAKELRDQMKIDNDGFIIEKYELYEDALERGDKELLAELLKDDSIYIYASLAWEGKPIRLKYYQDAIMTDDWRRIDVEAANQQGKSFSLCAKAACKFLQHHGKNTHIGLVSKSMSQNSMNMRMVKKMLKDGKFSYQSGSNDNMTVMVHEFPDGTTNTLVCSVATTSALGFPFDWLLLDEFEFWENPEGLEYMYDQVLEPRTFHTKGQIIIYSNPNGKNYVSENLQKRTIKIPLRVGGQGNGRQERQFREEYQFHTYNVDFLDNPANTREEWDNKKKYVHPIIFASTMAAQRTEAEGSALTDADIMLTKDEELDRLGFYGCIDKPSYYFLDLGFVYDQSCLVGCYLTTNDKGETVYNFPVKTYPRAYEHEFLWGRKEGSEQSVPDIIKQYGNQMSAFELDLTGKEGNEILANEAGLSCRGVKMSGPWKAKWYERFITLVKQGRLKVQTIDNWLDTQNKNFEFQARSLQISTKKPDGNNRPYPLYHHTNEKDHDDILDAVVGCLSLVDEDMTAQPSVSFFESGRQDKHNEEEEDMHETAYRLNRQNNFTLFYGEGM